jgi:hypothetical protein
MAFDPNKKYSNALPAGSYLLAMVKFERKNGRKPPYHPYMNCTFLVIDGPSKGRKFFSMIGLDESNDGAMGRLSLYCKACGVTQAFELSDDEAFSDAFMHKPFKAEVKQTQNGDYTNNDIQRYELNLTRREVEIGDAYWNKVQDEADGRAGAGGNDDFAGGDGGDFSDSGGGDDSFDFGANAADDDIPFGS